MIVRLFFVGIDALLWIRWKEIKRMGADTKTVLTPDFDSESVWEEEDVWTKPLDNPTPVIQNWNHSSCRSGLLLLSTFELIVISEISALVN